MNTRFSAEISNIMKPFMEKIQQSKQKIRQKTKLFQQEQIDEITNEDQTLYVNKRQLTSQSNISYISYKKILNNKLEQQDTQQDKQPQKQNKQINQLMLKQWPGRNKQRIFQNVTNMHQQYQKIFQKKIKQKNKKENVYSYKNAEKEMFQKIYNQYKNSESETISFQNVRKFLKSHQLFLHVYGINYADIQNILNFSSLQYSNKLTKEEFLRLFLGNIFHKTEKQVQNIQENSQKNCCFSQQNWNQLQNIFNQLDTFGDGYIKKQELFHKMKTISVSRQLLEGNVIYFPLLKRYYTFKKVMFELQNKKNLPSTLTWNYLSNQLINFQHIDSPTIDEIFIQQVKKAHIIQDSHSFLINEEILNLLKEQFQRCLKFNKYFVKNRYFCQQLLSNNQLKAYLKEYVRQDNSNIKRSYITLEQNIKMIKLYGLQYFDLDQMLIYFSVKGFQKQLRLKRFQGTIQNQFNEDQSFQQRKKLKSKLKKIQSLEKVEKVMKGYFINDFQKNDSRDKQVNKSMRNKTKFQEFKITKKRDYLTIRQKKVIEMIKQKEQKQNSQIKPYVKARTIPSSINCQKHQEQKRKFQAIKQQQKIERFIQKGEDQKRIKYLMENTKLFEKEKEKLLTLDNKNLNLMQKYQKFQPKPIQWFVKQRNLLEVIENQKQQRRKNRLKETKQKYIYGHWKKLPYDHQQEDIEYHSEDSIQKELSMREILPSTQKSRIKATPVPNFKKLQQEFEKQLEQKKKTKSPTVIKEFNLTVPKQRKIQLSSLSKDIKSPNKLTQTTRINNDNPVIIGTTAKFQSMVQQNRKKIERKKYEEYLKSVQQQQRSAKRKIFAKFMKNALKQNLASSKTSKIHKKRKAQRNINKFHEKQLNKMYERVLSRPFLFQNPNSQKIIVSNVQKKLKSSKKLNVKNITKIRIPFEQNHLNAVQQLDWQDKQSSKYQEINAFGEKYKQIKFTDSKEYIQDNQYNGQNEQQQYQQQYCESIQESQQIQSRAINNMNNQSF